MKKEVLAECKRLRPLEFKHVTEPDVEKILLILWRNITYLMKQHALIAIKDCFILRPNVRYMIRSEWHRRRKEQYQESMKLKKRMARLNHRRLLDQEQKNGGKGTF
jgi:hypothetical protein